MTFEFEDAELQKKAEWLLNQAVKETRQTLGIAEDNVAASPKRMRTSLLGAFVVPPSPPPAQIFAAVAAAPDATATSAALTAAAADDECEVDREVVHFLDARAMLQRTRRHESEEFDSVCWILSLQINVPLVFKLWCVSRAGNSTSCQAERDFRSLTDEIHALTGSELPTKVDKKLVVRCNRDELDEVKALRKAEAANCDV